MSTTAATNHSGHTFRVGDEARWTLDAGLNEWVGTCRAFVDLGDMFPAVIVALDPACMFWSEGRTTYVTTVVVSLDTLEVPEPPPVVITSRERGTDALTITEADPVEWQADFARTIADGDVAYAIAESMGQTLAEYEARPTAAERLRAARAAVMGDDATAGEEHHNRRVDWSAQPEKMLRVDTMRRFLEGDTVPPECTGYVDDSGYLAHDGDTCPVHEPDDGAWFVLLDLEAVQPETLEFGEGVEVTVHAGRREHVSSRACSVDLASENRHALIAYVKEHWGDEDPEWFATYVVARIACVR